MGGSSDVFERGKVIFCGNSMCFNSFFFFLFFFFFWWLEGGRERKGGFVTGYGLHWSKVVWGAAG